ncbi:hypothetical protein P168DRAFT_3216 [Aspergillus campestris IBT 28561]|uniref:Ras-GEF domain-containing protein n=1 Tax=Aspergillus campestris (strain IBT 28561) TaxID=1392248 RepID=A0A2I1DD94_ASPC2|nr:uncharacterized protein P168DRAFT_3216 [Aspergillus campestris IBT 28561]PKY07835.1 hypothetical protein P168DRAFT_3216 [Aspergillus campestris IBT 28561]
MSGYSPHQSGAPSAGPLPGQSEYPSLFQSTAEVPPFYVSYLWWEDEAATILWAFDVEKVKRVIRYSLFPDENFPRKALQNRHGNTVDDFLSGLVQPHERNFIPNLSQVQKVEEIMRRCRISSPPPAAWSWFPGQKANEPDPEAIARGIDTESFLHFTRISFEELVRYALGYKVASVEWFLQQHTALYVHLLDYLSAFPDEIARYVEVETHLRSRSPFAHRALVHCLRTVNPGQCASMETSAGLGFEFIAAPIQRIFRDLPPSLTNILKVLSVLGVRFQRTYVHAREMDWTRPFNVAFSFLEDLLDATSPVDFARTLTSADEEQFATLTPQSFVTQDATANNLMKRWEMQSIDVWECCTGLPENIAYIQECLQALFAIRNFHSLTAILDGLRKYSLTESTMATAANGADTVALKSVTPPSLLELLDPTDNFATYRQLYQASPGIPFLFPHIRECQQGGQPPLRQLFQQMQPIMD